MPPYSPEEEQRMRPLVVDFFKQHVPTKLAMVDQILKLGLPEAELFPRLRKKYAKEIEGSAQLRRRLEQFFAAHAPADAMHVQPLMERNMDVETLFSKLYAKYKVPADQRSQASDSASAAGTGQEVLKKKLEAFFDARQPEKRDELVQRALRANLPEKQLFAALEKKYGSSKAATPVTSGGPSKAQSAAPSKAPSVANGSITSLASSATRRSSIHEREQLRAKLREFYTAHSPEADVEAKVEYALSLKMGEKMLFASLYRKYNLDANGNPLPSEDVAEASGDTASVGHQERDVARERLRERLTAFYTRVNPSGMEAKVEYAMMLDVEEEELFKKLYKQYNLSETGEPLRRHNHHENEELRGRLVEFFTRYCPSDVEAHVEAALSMDEDEETLLQRLQREFAAESEGAAPAVAGGESVEATGAPAADPAEMDVPERAELAEAEDEAPTAASAVTAHAEEGSAPQQPSAEADTPADEIELHREELHTHRPNASVAPSDAGLARSEEIVEDADAPSDADQDLYSTAHADYYEQQHSARAEVPPPLPPPSHFQSATPPAVATARTDIVESAHGPAGGESPSFAAGEDVEPRGGSAQSLAAMVGAMTASGEAPPTTTDGDPADSTAAVVPHVSDTGSTTAQPVAVVGPPSESPTIVTQKHRLFPGDYWRSVYTANEWAVLKCLCAEAELACDAEGRCVAKASCTDQGLYVRFLVKHGEAIPPQEIQASLVQHQFDRLYAIYGRHCATTHTVPVVCHLPQSFARILEQYPKEGQESFSAAFNKDAGSFAAAFGGTVTTSPFYPIFPDNEHHQFGGVAGNGLAPPPVIGLYATAVIDFPSEALRVAFRVCLDRHRGIRSPHLERAVSELGGNPTSAAYVRLQEVERRSSQQGNAPGEGRMGSFAPCGPITHSGINGSGANGAPMGEGRLPIGERPTTESRKGWSGSMNYPPPHQQPTHGAQRPSLPATGLDWTGNPHLYRDDLSTYAGQSEAYIPGPGAESDCYSELGRPETPAGGAAGPPIAPRPNSVASHSRHPPTVNGSSKAEEEPSDDAAPAAPAGSRSTSEDAPDAAAKGKEQQLVLLLHAARRLLDESRKKESVVQEKERMAARLEEQLRVRAETLDRLERRLRQETEERRQRRKSRQPGTEMSNGGEASAPPLGESKNGSRRSVSSKAQPVPQGEPSPAPEDAPGSHLDGHIYTDDAPSNHHKSASLSEAPLDAANDPHQEFLAARRAKSSHTYCL